MNRPAFLWEYSMRFRGAGETNMLGPEFIHTDQENLRRWRDFQSGKRKTLYLPGLAPEQPKEPAHVGSPPEVKDDVDDATESMKSLGFRDMDIDNNHGLPNTNPVSPPPRAPAALTQPGAAPPPPRIQTAPPPSNVYVQVPLRGKTAPVHPPAPPETAQNKKPAGVKRKLPEESESQPAETTKRARTVDRPSQPFLVKCERCTRLGITCIPRKPGKSSNHPKAMTACAECARLKYGCKFPVFADAQEDVVNSVAKVQF